MLNKEVLISTEYVTLQQLLKLAEIINSGGQAKVFIANNSIIVNNEKENRRGRKLYPGDVIIINSKTNLTVKKK